MFKKDSIELQLDKAIVELLEELNQTQDKTDESYAMMVDQLVKLHELRHKSRISKDTLATIAANFIGLVVVMNHERAHIIATKAFGFVKKIV